MDDEQRGSAHPRRPSQIPDELRLVYGGRGSEREIAGHADSPTWIVNQTYDKVAALVHASLDAYTRLCAAKGIPHAYLLGLDILISGEIDSRGNVVDIKPVMVEGPCCNSNPACPSIDTVRLYHRAVLEGMDPDRVEFPVHPARILDTLTGVFRSAWEARTGEREPVVAVFTRPYPKSEEETAHTLVVQACRDAGLRVFRVTPDEAPAVSKDKLTVGGVPIDVCYRRITAAEVPIHYGPELAAALFEHAPETVFINPWAVDRFRSKAVEEACFRAHEAAGGAPVARPKTLIGDEVTRGAVSELFSASGYVLKRSDSFGGNGVYLHLNLDRVRPVFDALYGKYDGRRMNFHSGDWRPSSQEWQDEMTGDVVVQQLRVLDSRTSPSGVRLAYDLRVNVLFDPIEETWRILSGISRCVPMGIEGDTGNSLLTNVSSGAEIAPLFMGPAKAGGAPMLAGRLLESLEAGQGEWAPG